MSDDVVGWKVSWMDARGHNKAMGPLIKMETGSKRFPTRTEADAFAAEKRAIADHVVSVSPVHLSIGRTKAGKQRQVRIGL